jgi:hypothetical protein
VHRQCDTSNRVIVGVSRSDERGDQLREASLDREQRVNMRDGACLIA